MNSFLYVHTGSVTFCPGGDGQTAGEREFVQLTPGTTVTVEGASGRSGFLFLASFPNNEPIAREGPFVMNTEEEIEQAYRDYRNGLLG